jgi:hypothetical protein
MLNDLPVRGGQIVQLSVDLGAVLVTPASAAAREQWHPGLRSAVRYVHTRVCHVSFQVRYGSTR